MIDSWSSTANIEDVSPADQPHLRSSVALFTNAHARDRSAFTIPLSTFTSAADIHSFAQLHSALPQKWRFHMPDPFFPTRAVQPVMMPTYLDNQSS
jgi:hypothetical protein